ncbi:MAG: DUF4382 domain-containing protein [Sphingobacteriales bacterium]|nr:MAG: DUF4382 domain-containing protein [Sphingobacteriales bacterium]
MKRNQLILAVAGFFLPSIVFLSCDKDDSGNQTTELRVNLTDAPIDELDSVYVDIKEVNVKLGDDTLTSGNDESGWVNIDINKGIYDLLSYQNGVDTLLGTGIIPTGYLKEIRLVLGSNNYVIDTFGVSHPLTIPSGGSSGLKIKINKPVYGPVDSVLLDFDAALSIKNEGASGYKLRPVIKLK